MSTPNRTEINQANAQRSTGPKTPEGKKISSLNALRHGLTGQMIVMPTEDLAAYQSHLKSFTDEYSPKGATESHLVQALADTSWRLNRVAALETNLLSLTVVSAPDPITGAVSMAAAIETHSKALSNLSMHSQRLSRQFERAVTQLRHLQIIRHIEEKHDLNKVVDIIEMYEDKGETYDPSADGFVFSELQIKEALRARNRETLAAEARHHRYESAAA
jgi:hypothetical protein